MDKTYYELLGVPPAATEAAIRAAYQRHMQGFQERMRQGTPAPAAEFDGISRAYAVLRDAAKRRAYDTGLRQAADGAPPAAPVLELQPMESKEVHEERFSFHGAGGEYFRIWIVNLLLSILTLGIYSAWAKVRREQYFHRNLLLDASGFDYHATPRAILLGRLIALVLLLVVSAARKAGPLSYAIVMFLALGVVPWLLMRALRFRARNTSYRGLRFAFRGSYGGALGAFVGFWLLTLVSMGLLAPLWLREMRKYVLNNLYYANERFRLEIGIWPFYRAVLLPIFVIFLSFMVLGFVSVALGKAGAILFVTCLGFGGLFVYLAALAYIRMSLTNLVWNHAQLGRHHFFSEMRFGGYLGVVAANWFLIVLTLGIYWPWAQVRLLRYRAAHTAIAVAGGLDGFIASAGEEEAALGDEAAALFDFDIAL